MEKWDSRSYELSVLNEALHLAIGFVELKPTLVSSTKMQLEFHSYAYTNIKCA